MVKTLAGVETRSELVFKTFMALNKAKVLSKANSIKIRWIRSHSGFVGNELADEFARQGRLDNSMGVIDNPKPTYKHLKSLVATAIVETWNDSWAREQTCRQTRLWIPHVRPRLSAYVMSMNRRILSKYILTVTGHNFWNRHNWIVDKGRLEREEITPEEVTSPVCDLCWVDTAVPPQSPDAGPHQSSEHLFADCARLAAARSSIFKMPYGVPLHEIEGKDILRFIDLAELEVFPTDTNLSELHE